ncbi:MAG: hypothetical protein HUK01_04800 [Bacteroidaceae bacterium]|nr:hypothetical protein [Bacteroidaceae bacterium]
MAIRTILICTLMAMTPCVASHANATPALTTADEATLVCAADTLDNAVARKRRRMTEAFGKVATDTVAEGGIDYNPFSKEYMSKRHNPYTYSMDENMRKKLDEVGGDTFLIEKEPWYQRFTVGGFIGFNMFAQQHSYTIKPSVVLGGLIGYNFNQLHMVRFTANFSQFKSSSWDRSLWNVRFGLDYMFNLSNYMYGVNAKRLFNFSPVFGFGLDYSRASGNQKTLTKDVRIGLNIDRPLSGNSHIFIEPYVICANDKIDLLRDHSNPRKYNVLWGVLAGLRMDMRPDDQKQKNWYCPDFNPSFFLEFTVGPHFYGQQYKGGSAILNTMGSNYQLMLGRWFDPYFGVRFGMASGDFLWEKTENPAIEIGGTTIRGPQTVYRRGGMIAGRGELMFRPLNLFNRWRETSHKFELDLSVGFELGGYVKTKVFGYGNLRTFYYGFTGAIDLLYKIAPNTWLMLQPRAVAAYYSVPRTDHGNEGNYRDELYSLNFGIRIQRPTKEERYVMFENDFRPHYELAFYGGTEKRIDKIHYATKERMNWMGGLSLAYNFTPLHSVMFEGDYMRINVQGEQRYEVKSGTKMIRYSGMATRSFNILDFALAYRINLANLITGNDYDRRRFNFYGYFGPGLAFHLNTGYKLNEGTLAGGQGEPNFVGKNLSGTTSFNIQGGLIATYSLSDHVDVMIKPEAVYMCNEYCSPSAQFLMKINAGLNFHF